MSIANDSSEDVVEATKQPVGPPDEPTSKQADKDYAKWLKSKEARSVDLGTVERHEVESDTGRPLETDLEGAADQAEVIVRGVVTDIKFVPSGTLTKFKVDKTFKGNVGSVLRYVQRSALRPTSDDQGVYLAEDIGEPLLEPGDEAVLMLKEPLGTESKQDLAEDAKERNEKVPERSLRVLVNIGQYRIETGKIETNEHSLTRGVDGIGVDEFAARLETHTSEQAEDE